MMFLTFEVAVISNRVAFLSTDYWQLSASKVRLRTIVLTQNGVDDMRLDDGDARRELLEHDEWRRVLPRFDVIGTRKFARCAIVGNSAILLGQRFGAAIDAHDAVFRFNWPPIDDKYSLDVGEKTTFMFSGSAGGFRSDHHPFRSVHDFARDVAVLQLVPIPFWRNATARRELRRAMNDSVVFGRAFITSPYLVEVADSLLLCYLEQSLAHNVAVAAHNNSGNNNRSDRLLMQRSERQIGASSGLRAVLVALRICAQTNLYGFGVSPLYGKAHYYHHGKPQFVHEKADHSYAVEHRLLRLLASERETWSVEMTRCSEALDESFVMPNVARRRLRIHTNGSLQLGTDY